MRTVNFSFTTKLTFDDYVNGHSFALRVIPPESASQHILSCSLSVSPFTDMQQTADAFGNHVTSGYLAGDHRFLDFELKGSAELDLSKPKTDYMPCYRYQSDYTQPDEQLRAFYDAQKAQCHSDNIPERVAYFSNVISGIITYEKGVTTTKTTAAEAFALKKGVCQDFAHILLSVLRMDDIP